MRASQSIWRPGKGWTGKGWDDSPADFAPGLVPDLVLAFGASKALADGVAWPELIRRYPNAIVLGCSTGGEIHGSEVVDDTVTATAMKFASTKLVAAQADVADGGSFEAGAAIATKLARPDLKAIFILSDGTKVNGSDLVRGLRAVVGQVVLTGGLAGDGARFEQTYVGLNGELKPGKIAAVGFYGENFRVGHGSGGGWDVFGPERLITSAKGNVLHELDRQPALDLYKRYLGEEEAEKLPGSALLFPLRIYPPDKPDHAIVRTVVGIDEAAHSMTFAGDMPNGFCAQLMRGNIDHLVQSAAHAAEAASGGKPADRVAILVSCIGRKLLMGQRIGEEVEAVHEVLGNAVTMTGFYSYGEVSPHAATGHAELHNQTMAITILGEARRA